MQTNRPADNYSPLYFLASVGAGGLSVTFFMYLMFWVPHPGRPVPIFEDIMAAFSTGGAPLKTAIIIAMSGIAVFAFINLKKLFWNISAFNRFRKTEGYQKLRNSNAETTLLAYPLALAMSVNGLFIVGLVFVPGLWSIVEILFPFAMAAFLAIGIFALSIIGDFLGRVLTKGGLFDVTAHNSFAQMLPTFAAHCRRPSRPPRRREWGRFRAGRPDRRQLRPPPCRNRVASSSPPPCSAKS